MADEKNSGNRKERVRVVYDTRLDQFLFRHAVNLDLLGKEATMSRNNLGRLREGKTKPRQDTIIRLVKALRRIVGDSVKASDLFYLGEAHDDQSPEAKEFLAA